MFSSIIEAFALYSFLLLSIGVYFYHTNKSQEDFALGGRKLNYWVTALSAQASDMSDWLFMGLPGIVYAQGLINVWTAFGLAFFMFLTWHFIAPRFRIETERTDSITLTSFLQAKFNDKTNTIRIIGGLLCLYYFTFYMAAGLVGLGRVFEVAFSIDYYHGILIGLAITLTYTILGGLLAIAWSDLIQGVFLLIAIIAVPFYAMQQLGGMSSVLTILQDQGPEYLSLFPIKNNLLSIFFGITTWGLGYFGQPHILINFMSIDNPSNIKKAKVVGLCWQILALTSAIFVGIIGKAFISPALENKELVFIIMVKTLFSPFLAGLILCAILAATISTINTQALISASLISNDLYYPITNHKASPQQELILTRIAMFIIPIFALATAYYNSASVLELVLYAWSGLGCSFGPLVILSLYSTFVTREGAIAGLVTGALVGTLWPMLNSSIPTLLVGFILNFSITFIVSKLTKQK